MKFIAYISFTTLKEYVLDAPTLEVATKRARDMLRREKGIDHYLDAIEEYDETKTPVDETAALDGDPPVAQR